MWRICGKLKTIDCTVPSQIVGRFPVKPTSGNAGRPDPNVNDGMKTSLVCDSSARAFKTSASASFTALLFCWARSTMVCNDTWDGKSADAPPRTSPTAAFLQAAFDLCPLLTCEFPVTISRPVPVCNRGPGPAPPPAPAAPPLHRPVVSSAVPASGAPQTPGPPRF